MRCLRSWSRRVIVTFHSSGVALSSHLIADLERVCDYLVVLAASRVQLAGEVSELLSSHYRLSGAAAGGRAGRTGRAGGQAGWHGLCSRAAAIT